MRYRLIATVDADININGTVSVERDGLLFEFLPDKSGRVAEVAISRKVPPEKIASFVSKVEVNRNSNSAKVTIEGDIELHRTLVTQLQILESNLAFASLGSLRGIHWDSLKQEFIPENPQEEELIDVVSFSRSREYPRKPVSLTASDLHNLVMTSPRYDELYILKAFWRQGANFFNDFRYIEAFYNFYFVIEGLYAKGKTGKKTVLKEFGKPEELGGILQNALQALFNLPRHKESLVRLFQEENCDISVQGLQELLFEVRGNLHHYSIASPKTRGTPFNQQEFESLALLMMHISDAAIAHRILAINCQTSDT